jgi:hypothetical protein
VLAEAKNTPGTVRRIWMTMPDRSPQMLRGLKLEMFWDGAASPAVSAPVGDFFGVGLGLMAQFESALFSNPEGRSLNSFVPMPFRTGMRIVMTNESGRDLPELFYDVNYTLGDRHPAGVLYFHAHWRRENPTTIKRDYEILPRVEKQFNVRITKDPDARATMGCSSGGSAAMAMAWYHPELYHRVLTYSGTYVNQQYPYNPETPGGAWEFHRTLIPKSPVKPIRIWMHVGDRDLFNPHVMRDDMHDGVVANERMATVVAEKGYKYQFVFARDSGHCDRNVKWQTLPNALEFVWKDYPVDTKLKR